MSFPFITGSRFKSAGDFVPFEYNAVQVSNPGLELTRAAKDFIFSVNQISSSNFHVIGGFYFNYAPSSSLNGRFRVYRIKDDGTSQMVYMFHGFAYGQGVYLPQINKKITIGSAPSLLTGHMYIFHPGVKYRLKFAARQNNIGHSFNIPILQESILGDIYPRTSNKKGLPWPPEQFYASQNAMRALGSQWQRAILPERVEEGFGITGIPTPLSNPMDLGIIPSGDFPLAKTKDMNFKFKVATPQMLELWWKEKQLNPINKIEGAIFEDNKWIGNIDRDQIKIWTVGQHSSHLGWAIFGFYPRDEWDGGKNGSNYKHNFDLYAKGTFESNRIFFYPGNTYQIQFTNTTDNLNQVPTECRLVNAVFNAMAGYGGYVPNFSDGNENISSAGPVP